MPERKPRIFWEMKVGDWTVRVDHLTENYLMVTFHYDGQLQSMELWHKLEESKA